MISNTDDLLSQRTSRSRAIGSSYGELLSFASDTESQTDIIRKRSKAGDTDSGEGDGTSGNIKGPFFSTTNQGQISVEATSEVTAQEGSLKTYALGRGRIQALQRQLVLNAYHQAATQTTTQANINAIVASAANNGDVAIVAGVATETTPVQQRRFGQRFVASATALASISKTIETNKFITQEKIKAAAVKWGSATDASGEIVIVGQDNGDTGNGDRNYTAIARTKKIPEIFFKPMANAGAANGLPNGQGAAIKTPGSEPATATAATANTTSRARARTTAATTTAAVTVVATDAGAAQKKPHVATVSATALSSVIDARSQRGTVQAAGAQAAVVKEPAADTKGIKQQPTALIEKVAPLTKVAALQPVAVNVQPKEQPRTVTAKVEPVAVQENKVKVAPVVTKEPVITAQAKGPVDNGPKGTVVVQPHITTKLPETREVKTPQAPVHQKPAAVVEAAPRDGVQRNTTEAPKRVDGTRAADAGTRLPADKTTEKRVPDKVTKDPLPKTRVAEAAPVDRGNTSRITGTEGSRQPVQKVPEKAVKQPETAPKEVPPKVAEAPPKETPPKAAEAPPKKSGEYVSIAEEMQKRQAEREAREAQRAAEAQRPKTEEPQRRQRVAEADIPREGTAGNSRRAPSMAPTIG